MSESKTTDAVAGPVAEAQVSSSPQHAALKAEALKPHDWAVLILFAVLLLMVSVLRLLAGDHFGFGSWDIFKLRLLDLCMGLTVGAALAVAGALLQALLRNPLASPYLLGVSSGAALGMMFNQFLLYQGLIGSIHVMGDQAAAVIGAMTALAVVYVLSQKRGTIDPLGLLLVGVIVNAVNGAAIMFINYLSPRGLRGDMSLWMMGYLDANATWTTMLSVLVMTGVVIAVAIRLGRALDVSTFSDAEAHSMGLNLGRLRLGVFALAGLLTAGSVLLAGPIGFVGLICPHIVRVMLGPRHRLLIAGSAMAGAILIVGAEVVIKLANVGQGLMPVGAIMAIIGGPVFLWMLRPQLGRGADS